MTEALERLRGHLLRREMLAVSLLAAVVFAAIPLLLGHIGLSWDALNHHIYLGWAAEHPRFDQDYIAASYQAYQFPYLYWPVYRLAMAGLSGAVAGSILALLAATAVPAVWLIAQSCIPGRDWFAIGLRFVAVVLAFTNGVVLSLLDTTANDLLAAIPLVWAIALAAKQLRPDAATARGLLRPVWLSGALSGVSVAFKFSNGPIAVLMPVLWMLVPGTWPQRLGRSLAGGVCAAVACVLVYGWWGWELWEHFGNPVYYLYDHLFEGLRTWTGWKR